MKKHSPILFIAVFVLFFVAIFLLSQSGNYYNNYVFAQASPSPSPSPSPTPSPLPKCGGVEYNPATHFCCGDPSSDLAAIFAKNDPHQDCCSSSTNSIGFLFDPTFQACCGSPEIEGIIVYDKNNENCCTTLGAEGEDSQGFFPRMYSKDKGEKCCPVDGDTEPNVCDGCHRCVDADKTYINVFAPVCKGFLERTCYGQTSETKGECVDNCQDCTICTDASTVPDGSDGKPDRRPITNGKPQTVGVFCYNLEEKLTEDHYSDFVGDERPTKTENTYICQCAGWLTKCNPAGRNIQKCFQYDNAGSGYPAGGDNCPAGAVQSALVNGTCWCTGASRCSRGQEDKYGNSIYVCAEEGKACSEMVTEAGIEGRAELHYKLSSAGWTYDCGEANCCRLDEIKTNYCGGPGGMFCIHGTLPEGGGKWCAGHYNCTKTDDDDGGGGDGDGGGDDDDCLGGTVCNDQNQCVAAGECDGGSACDLANGDDDCIDQASCSADGLSCSVGGGHGVCEDVSDCQMYCTDDLKCSSEGTGIACTSNTDCEQQPTCSDDGKCVINGGHGTCPSVDSIGDDFCAKSFTYCDDSQKCTTNGNGQECDTANGDDDCIDAPGCTTEKTCEAGGDRGACDTAYGDLQCQLGAMPTYCDDNHQCTTEGGGASCETSADCYQEDDFTCNLARQCVYGGGGTSCTEYTLYESEDCPAPTCDIEEEICIPGGGGILCDENSDCGGNNPPTAEDLNIAHGDYCSSTLLGIPGTGLATFSWTYHDDEGSVQTQYQLEASTIPDDPETPEDEFEDGKVYLSSGENNNSSVSITLRLAKDTQGNLCFYYHSCNFINYGVDYYWRVKVWEGTGESLVASDWVYYQDQVSYRYPYAHPQPWVVYEPSAVITPQTNAIFTDQSTCYNDEGESYSCQCLVPNGTTTGACLHSHGKDTVVCNAADDFKPDSVDDCYSWWFDGYSDPFNPYDPEPLSTVIGSPLYSYPGQGTYETALQICDDIGCCYAVQDVEVTPTSGNVVPQWWEISPYK